jgi:hypothetical protein
VDDGDGGLHACHELGHGGDEATCNAQLASCTQSCGAALCDLVGHACHALDTADSGPFHECHELGHAGDATQCFLKGRACLELCESADGGHHDGGHHDGGHHDASHD